MGMVLYSVYYEQLATSGESELDLAFNDGILEDVEREWRVAMGNVGEGGEFMKFEERTGMGDDDDEDNDM